MTLSQLHSLKRWHLQNTERPVELTLCDLVIGAWLGGWILMPGVLLLSQWQLLPASLAMVLLPEAYCGLRARLHARGILRCDWLAVLSRR